MRIGIMFVALLLSSCANSNKDFMNHMRSADFGSSVVVAMPGMDYCFGLSRNESVAELNSLWVQYLDKIPLVGERPSDGSYGRKIGELVHVTYVNNHRTQFLKNVDQTKHDHCRQMFHEITGVAAK